MKRHCYIDMNKIELLSGERGQAETGLAARPERVSSIEITFGEQLLFKTELSNRIESRIVSYYNCLKLT
jgi:hypothetical protein